MRKIREFTLADLSAVQRIVQKLHPAWFDQQALANIPVDLHFQKTFVAEEGAILGFLSLRSQDGLPFIGWMGVDPDYHRQGIGSALLRRAEEEVCQAGAASLRVETVVEQSPGDGTYDLTLKFYRARGFVVETSSEPRFSGEFVYKMGTMRKSPLP